jgi:hypothetical protein
MAHPRARGQVADHAGDQVGQRGDLAAGLQDAGLDPAHVQEVLHQVGQAVGLDVDECGQPAARFGADVEPGIGQRGGRCLDRGERSAQVVRDRGDQRSGQARHLLGHPGPQRLLAKLGTLDGQRGLVSEQEQGLALVPAATGGAAQVASGEASRCTDSRLPVLQ